MPLWQGKWIAADRVRILRAQHGQTGSKCHTSNQGLDNSRLDAIGALPALASAQMTALMASNSDFERGRASSYSLIPFTSCSYAGINLGRSKFNGPCGGAFACMRIRSLGKIYTGGLFSRIIGAEMGYVNMGEVDRAGGTVDAHGVNISLVANLVFLRRSFKF